MRPETKPSLPEDSWLIPIKSLGRVKSRGRWLMLCKCGKEVSVITCEANAGRVKSCGCYAKTRLGKESLTHGNSVGKIKSPEITAYYSAKARCYRKDNERYAIYGGRGIRMCDRWKNDAAAFIKDMGPRPSQNHSLDRINPNKDYSPENCRWATDKEQRRNTRRSLIVEWDGDKIHFLDVPRHKSISKTHLRRRLIEYGWNIERAASEPCHPTRGRKQ